jgi:integrase/recombinase XerD
MIAIQKINHRGNLQILFTFSHDQSIIDALKQCEGIRYSQTYKGWYLPYDKSNWSAFLKLNLAYTISTNGPSDGASSIRANAVETIAEEPSICTHKAADDQEVLIRYMHPYFYVKGLKQETLPLIKTIQRSYWNDRYKNWVLPASEFTLKVLYEELSIISYDTYVTWLNQISNVYNPPVCTLYSSPEYADKVLIQLTGTNVDVEYLKHVPDRQYDMEGRYWIIPYDTQIIKRVTDHYQSKKTRIINRIKVDKLPSRKPSYGTLSKYLLENTAQELLYCAKPYMDMLVTQRYSQNSIKEYYSKFIKFAAIIAPLKCNEINEQVVNDFLRSISEQTKSESTINGYINAVKFYYNKVIYLPEFKIDRIKRPRTQKSLPKVISLQQVDGLLRATANLKHTTILFALYGHGIRLDELLCLKLDDIMWDRNQLFVEKGKGGKDRYVPLSQEFKEILRIYIHEYKPIYWVFEGQDRKNQYSERSVQEVVKKASKQAGIRLRVTPHSLRHSFATHLLDGGTQLPFIMEILGHSSIKTTMIYTHVTTASIQQVISPLDRLRQSLKISAQNNFEKPQ